MIWIGTSGFQYPEWKGTFYPSTLSKAKMLSYYAEHFRTTEINYSFRRIPSEKTLTNWDASTPSEFQFTFKAPQEITHIRKLRDCSNVLRRFFEAVVTMKDKLGVVLFQLPPLLRKDIPLLEEFLQLLPKEIRCAFEFRHASWFDDETFAALRSSNKALCVADSETLSTPVIVTADYSYFRLRHPAYSDADIVRWTGIIRPYATGLKDVYVYFKHEESGTGPRFARQMGKELGTKFR